MTDYSALRARLVVLGQWQATVCSSMLLAILDELDALRATVKPAKPKASNYPPAFDIAYEAAKASGITWRSGSTKPAAYIKWKERINAGATDVEMIAGAKAYAAHCKATGREIMMAQTFFGRGQHYTADWAVRKAGQPQSEKFHFDDIDRSGDQVAQAASMARHGIAIPDGEVEF
jgi:hypothetical protein